jgi:hypothetical protein
MLPIGQVIRNHGLTCHFYADYTVLYLSTSDSVAMCTTPIERCTDIKRWMNSNYMKLNTNKTELLVIDTPGHLNKVPAFNVNIGDDCVEVSKQIKNLGVVFGRIMKMQTYIREVVRNAMYHLHNISKIKQYLTYSVTEQVITSLVMSRVDYCNALLAGLPQSTIAPLQRVQNCAARILTGTRKFDHITPVLMKLHWLPVKYRIIYKICLLVFKCINSLAPGYLCELLLTVNSTSRRTTRSSSDKTRLQPVNTRLCTYGDRAFSAIAPRLWNQLNVCLREENSLCSFKSGLKTHLFREAFLT